MISIRSFNISFQRNCLHDLVLLLVLSSSFSSKEISQLIKVIALIYQADETPKIVNVFTRNNLKF